jgi:hypothetical protein
MNILDDILNEAFKIVKEKLIQAEIAKADFKAEPELSNRRLIIYIEHESSYRFEEYVKMRNVVYDKAMISKKQGWKENPIEFRLYFDNAHSAFMFAKHMPSTIDECKYISPYRASKQIEISW